MSDNCRSLFDINKRMPYIIPCGHTICQKCVNSLEYKNNNIKCPIDSHIYEITKEKIPKNEMLIYYIQTNNKKGPKYSYQIRECIIEEATFCHVDRRNCIQKICHFIWFLIYVKIFLTILNIFLWPFKKIFQLIKKIINLICMIILKIKAFFIKILNKIKTIMGYIKIPKINCNYCYKIKNKIINSKLAKQLIKFFKYTVRSPLWITYLKILKNFLYESQLKANNICFKIVNTAMALIGIFIAHIIAYYTNNLEFFFIILLLLNESIFVLIDLMEMDDEKENKKYLKKAKILKKKQNIWKNRKTSSDNKDDYDYEKEEEEYLNDKNKYLRGKKCIIRWIGFLLFWNFFPLIKNYIHKYVEYIEYSKNNDLEIQEKNIKIWMNVLKSLFFIPKLLIVIYLTC
jgi:hypothetical protein